MKNKEGEILAVHPLAEQFPMMSEEELDDLAQDIKQNGLVHPIVIDEDGTLIDGRNRKAAWERLEKPDQKNIKLRSIGLDGQDPVALILSNNVKRRDLNRGQKAMAVAFAYPEPERGRGKKDLALKVPESGSFKRERLRQARQVLRHSRELAVAVLNDTMKLDAAFAQVEREQRQLQSDEGKLIVLRKEAPDLAELVAEERLALEEAYATFEQRKHVEEERKNSQRETMMRLGEQVYTSTVAWSVESFIKSVNEFLEDDEFQAMFIARLRIDPSNLTDIEKGAKIFAELLKTLTEKKK
jgi:hypothetical protein